jgi:ABC-type transport system involved in cytochrome c biogenesis ATPase subunit
MRPIEVISGLIHGRVTSTIVARSVTLEKMTATDPVMLRAVGLGRRFGSLWAIRGMDLEVLRGEVLGLLGPNGAGKTTTVRVLTALIGPSEGRAWVDGLDVTERPEEVRARVGILTEAPGLYEKLSATANLAFFGRLYGLDAATSAERIEHYLRLFSLWDRRDEPAGTFSKGMKQKLAIARPGGRLHRPRGDRGTAPIGPDDRPRDAQSRRGGPIVRPGRLRARRAVAGRFAGQAAGIAGWAWRRGRSGGAGR